jgi:hypothetical protein
MKYKKPIVKLIEEAAKTIVKSGKCSFTRMKIIKELQKVYPDINDSTVRPMIQGMTLNIPGGAPGALDKNVFLWVQRGKFVLLNKENYQKYIGFSTDEDNA